MDIAAMGHRFEKICFVRSGGPGDTRAFQRALRLCERTNADLSIVSVTETAPPGILRLMESYGLSLEMAASARSASAELERLLEVAHQRNIRAFGDTLRGSASLEVIRKIQSEGHDLLIKAAQPSTVVRDVLFGHTDRRLVRKCPCPVWIEKPSSGVQHERILAAVDPAPFQDGPDYDQKHEELNVSILRSATILSQVEEAELHVVHAWDFSLAGPLESRVGLTEKAIADVERSVMHAHNEAFARLLQPFREHITRVHLVNGHAANEICRLTVDTAIDVVVMGTMCRSGVEGWLIGNTAETVLDHAECSVLALKPSGFASPIHG